MLILLSPSKTLDFESPLPKLTTSQPVLLSESKKLIACLKKKSVADIKELMDLSDKLATLNVSRYKNFDKAATRPALFAFKGDVYAPLRLDTYGKQELAYANAHVRMLSGLYGLLRPLDEIAPHRLEMGTRLVVGKNKNLYEFWGDAITENINAILAKQGGGTLINLASQEYFAVVNSKKINSKIITVQFKEARGGAFKTIGVHAKHARGIMADFAIRHNIDIPEYLKDFSAEGYAFSKTLSTSGDWVFIR